ncbi:20S proteasome subunit beta [Raphidocelis subcapitata]|uniref:20S proteasome subunit beta n=1 Tax=Raphidocelis subcapitata TaxID=307507 RepID=A0A2V0P027_9CHLO|nr:20S proteasome subunit beta [Raphidocelis subcapitata]|eukprot:GBF93228.1 20S proteasome subunit beta [Raphidocelis subcapitata]
MAAQARQASLGGRPGSSRPPMRASLASWRAPRTRNAVLAFQAPPKAPAGMANKKIKLSFKLPYRCHFGQDLCIVGSSEDLGNWDPRRGVGMQWSEGDVWQVEFEVSAGPQLELEYKYVVRNPDGGIAAWKPGSNFRVRVGADTGRAAPLPGGVAVRDAWDGSLRDVRIEVLEEGRPARPMTDAEREQMSFRVSLVSALDELSSQIGDAEQLSSSTGDPTSPDVLQADRLVAAATRKAVAMAHALSAAQAQARLTSPVEAGRDEQA